MTCHSLAPDLSISRLHWHAGDDPDWTHVVDVAGVSIGGDRPVIIAGPCAVESREQTLTIARAVRDAGGDLLRGGAYKPRTNPHSFQGLGEAGLEILAGAREETGLGIVTEVLDPRLVETVAGYADMLQIGSRNMQNYPLLKEVGASGMPVLLKRAWAATLEEWLGAAEYVALEGNRDIALCERGIRACCHWEYSRNLLDLSVVQAVREATPLPVIVDPSHAAGTAALVPGLARAGLAASAHGLLVEVVASEEQRATLQCDAAQGILPDRLAEICLTERREVADASPRGVAS